MSASRIVRFAVFGMGLGGVASLVPACSSKPEPHAATSFVKAQPQPDPPKVPAVIQVPQPLPLPGQLKALPPHEALDAEPHRREARPHGRRRARGEAAAATSSRGVVKAAHDNAAQSPDESGFFNAVMTYAFAPGALYQVYTAPLRVTDIVLEPGEKIVGKPAAGDTVRWVMGLGRSAEGGVDQQHVYLKPTQPDLHTNLAINTDRRTYLLELHSYADAFMAAVQWRYPQQEVERLEAAASEEEAKDKAVTATHIRLENLHFNYAIQLVKGKPTWTPVQVFDDGNKTFIRFPPAMLVGEAPALFIVSNKETQLVNYRVKDEYYIVDRLFEYAELRVGQKDPHIVRIVRN